MCPPRKPTGRSLLFRTLDRPYRGGDSRVTHRMDPDRQAVRYRRLHEPLEPARLVDQDAGLLAALERLGHGSGPARDRPVGEQLRPDDWQVREGPVADEPRVRKEEDVRPPPIIG
jgi:hypothetical protein